MLQSTPFESSITYALATGAAGSIIAAIVIYIFFKITKIFYVGVKTYQLRKLRKFWILDRTGRLQFEIARHDVGIYLGMLIILVMFAFLNFFAVAGDKIQLDANNLADRYILSSIKDHLYDNSWSPWAICIGTLFMLPLISAVIPKIDVTRFAINPLRYMKVRERLFNLSSAELAPMRTYYENLFKRP